VVKKMSWKKSGMKKENSSLQDSRLLGIIDKAVPTKRAMRIAVPPSLQTRRTATTAESDKAYYEAQAITLIRQASIR
jgi:hypothetical protein